MLNFSQRYTGMHARACVCVVGWGEGVGVGVGRGGEVVGCPMSGCMPLCVFVFVIHVAAKRFSLSLRTDINKVLSLCHCHYLL